jgi:hypothetical protein
MLRTRVIVRCRCVSVLSGFGSQNLSGFSPQDNETEEAVTPKLRHLALQNYLPIISLRVRSQGEET